MPTPGCGYLASCSAFVTTAETLTARASLTDFAHTALLVHAVYFYTITSFSNPDALQHIVWSLQATILFVGISMLVVRVRPPPALSRTANYNARAQTYFCAVRVRRLTGSALVAAACWVPALLAAALNLSVAVSVFEHPYWALARTASFQWRLTAIVCLSAAADVLVAACIGWGLFKLRSGFSASDAVVDKLIVCTVGALLPEMDSAGAEIPHRIWAPHRRGVRH